MPLTTSLFVPGRIKAASHVLVDVGTGFYVGKSLDDASAILEKKVRDPLAALPSDTAPVAALPCAGSGRPTSCGSRGGGERRVTMP